MGVIKEQVKIDVQGATEGSQFDKYKKEQIVKISK